MSEDDKQITPFNEIQSSGVHFIFLWHAHYLH